MQELEATGRADVISYLERTNSGQIAKTTNNFLDIFLHDIRFSNVHFNVLRNNAEIHEGENVRPWVDADEAAARAYMEKAYGLYARDKFTDALRLFFRAREYNPILKVVEAAKWDGAARCENFLRRWAGVDDTPYTREVSRLIFAGGIWRLYKPGCKFDDVPILIGKKQGEGKSSLIRFLAINDAWFGEVNTFEGQPSVEQLSGKWICEIGELLALTRTKEVEASKAYITRAVDQYRKPYDRNVTELPRRCIFIGTTNNETPLRDIYNRRYYPVTVKSTGYDLYNNEAEIREYILQCWAEAKERYKAGDMPNFARRDLVDDYREAQDNARQDDWRQGAIEAYLDDKPAGYCVCVREITNKALYKDGLGREPSVLDSKDIGMIMSRFDEWERIGRYRFPEYGQQRAWRKTDETFKELKERDDDLPF